MAKLTALRGSLKSNFSNLKWWSPVSAFWGNLNNLLTGNDEKTAHLRSEAVYWSFLLPFVKEWNQSKQRHVEDEMEEVWPANGQKRLSLTVTGFTVGFWTMAHSGRVSLLERERISSVRGVKTNRCPIKGKFEFVKKNWITATKKVESGNREDLTIRPTKMNFFEAIWEMIQNWESEWNEKHRSRHESDEIQMITRNLNR
jgi:hypothetical protein